MASNRQKPLELCDHTGYTLMQSHDDLQKDLNDLKVFTKRNLMTINQKKFNFHKGACKYYISTLGVGGGSEGKAYFSYVVRGV